MSKMIDILNRKGEKVGDYEIADSALELEKGTQAVHDAVVAFLNETRAGTASSKTRAEVSGSGRKPTRQKGGGRARVGSTRNPVWRHGGVAFGPKPRDFSGKINAKVKRLALKRSFSECVNDSKIIVVEDFSLESPKTKEATAALKALKADHGKLLFLVREYDDNAQLATGNLPFVLMTKAARAHTYQILWADQLLFTKEALDDFIQRISGAGKEQNA